MNKNALWKWLLLICLTAGSLALVLPLNDQFDEAGNLVKEGKVKLGLDLKGGTKFVLQVDTSGMSDKEAKNAAQRDLEVLRNRVDSMGISEPILQVLGKDRIVVQLPGLRPEDRERALENIKKAAFLEFRIVHKDNAELVNELFTSGLAPDGFRIVSKESGYYYVRNDSESIFDPIENTRLTKVMRKFHAPVGYELFLEKMDAGYKPIYIRSTPELTGKYLKYASTRTTQFGQPLVTLSFDKKGSKKFAQVTSDYQPGGPKNPSMEGRRQLAIVLDGTVFSAPVIQTAIYDGEAVIEGIEKTQEARDLALVLRAGSLQAPVKLVEERGVDPTLGKDSINSGISAAIIGGIAVLSFMLIYYLLAGLVADLALILDMILLPLGMVIVSGFLGIFSGPFGGSSMGLPTLTLPGIAGIVLTIGMAVDANVLIFERIREEIAAKKSLKGSVSKGYEKAFSTIFDANITTLLVAVILFWQGSGPVRGFAVTLSAGIVVSMFVALVITRLFFDTFAEHTSKTSIKIRSLFKNPNFDFLGKRKLALLISLSLILISWVIFANKGEDNFGVDFTGGSSVTFSFDQKQQIGDLRGALKNAGLEEVKIQHQHDSLEGDKSSEALLVKVEYGKGQDVADTLTSVFPDSGFKVMQTDNVGPQIGKELKAKGIKAIIVALIGIVIYISIRFEFSFAVGAIVALAHDVLITVGIFCLLGNLLSLPVVAALLMIVGYSVNDTIVVFDRIREDLGLEHGRPYLEIANKGINQTLSRTLLTSFTTLLTVLMLLFFGGGAIHDFALTLFIGILVGTYSSIFVATPVMLLWHGDKKKA